MTPTAVPELAIGLRGPLAALCVTQVVGWGIVHYSFPVLSGLIAADTGWSRPRLTAAFSAALVMSALAGIPVGRWLDRRGPRSVMTLGSVAAAVAMVTVGWSPSLTWFFASWLLAGAAMSAVLYPPAFAAVTRWYGPQRVRALTLLTLAGGLASTVFAPITALLADHLGWRGTYLVLAPLLAAVTIPLHFHGLRRPWPAPPTRSGQQPGRVARGRPFIALTVAMTLAASAGAAVVINLVPLLTERGMTTTIAAVALGLGGAGQVAGRLGYPTLSRRLDVRTRTVVVLTGVAVTTALLAALTAVAASVVTAVAAGAARGLVTLLQATAVTDRWGVADYGRLTGLLSAPVTLSAAVAPWLGAVLAAALHGYGPMFWVMSGIALVAAALGLASIPSVISRV